MKKALFLALFIGSLGPAYASLGKKVAPQLIPTGLCRLELEHIKTQDKFHCTGSLVGKRVIKTAAHCFEKAKLQKVQCLGANQEIKVESVEVYPEFDMNFIKRDKHHRWQDHAVILLEEDLNITPFKAVTKKSDFENIVKGNTTCLVAGFGLQEQTHFKMGKLSGTLYPSNLINFTQRIFLSQGAYRFELLPGDSGGPLLCHSNGFWYDLGTASAHDWDHNSVYAPNLEVSTWLSNFNLEEQTLKKSGHPFLQEKPISIEVGHSYYLKTYIEIKEAATGNSFYNGDNRHTTIEVERIENGLIFGTIEAAGSSQFYLCEENFLCYGQNTFGAVLSVDIYGTSPMPHPQAYDPFSKE